VPLADLSVFPRSACDRLNALKEHTNGIRTGDCTEKGDFLSPATAALTWHWLVSDSGIWT
jgi:hypothetical protein